MYDGCTPVVIQTRYIRAKRYFAGRDKVPPARASWERIPFHARTRFFTPTGPEDKGGLRVTPPSIIEVSDSTLKARPKSHLLSMSTSHMEALAQAEQLEKESDDNLVEFFMPELKNIKSGESATKILNNTQIKKLTRIGILENASSRGKGLVLTNKGRELFESQ